MRKTLEMLVVRLVSAWVIATLVLGVVTHPLIAATYYVNSSTGNDSRGASEAQDEATPWKTLSRATTESGLAEGDIIRLATGSYDSASGETFPIVPVDGVAILGSGAQDTTIDAGSAEAFQAAADYPLGFWIGDLTIATSGTGVALDISDAQIRTNVDGVAFSGVDTGIMVSQHAGSGGLVATVSNSTFNASSTGIDVSASSADSISLDLTVDNTTFTGGASGIDIYLSFVDDVDSRVTVNQSVFDGLFRGIEYYVYDADLNVESALTINNSTFSAIDYKPISASLSSVSSANAVDWQVGLLDSEFTDTERTDIDAWYLYDTDATIDYTISGNTFSQINTDAVSISVTSFSSVTMNTHLLVEDNTFGDINGDALYFFEGYGYFGDQNTDITIRGNTIADTSSDGIFLSFYECYYFDSKTLDVKILENELTNTGYDGISFDSEYLEEGGALRHHLTVAGNTVAGAGGDGIALYGSENSSNNLLDFDWTVVNNTVTGSAYTGISLNVSYLDYARGGRGNFTVAGNTVDASVYEGIYVDVSSWYASRVAQSVTVGGNTVTNAGWEGIGLDLSDQTSLTANLVRVEDNVVRGAADDGIYVDTDDYLGGTHVTISGNTLTDNGGSGLYLSGYTDNRGFVPFDLGGGALGSPGRNTFANNAAFAIDVRAYDSSEAAISAHDNYFGTTDANEIAAAVFDQADDGSYEALDASTPLETQPTTYGADVALAVEVVDDTGAQGVTPDDVLRITATLTGTGEIGCRVAWFDAALPAGATALADTATTSLGAVLDQGADGLSVAVGYVPVTYPVTISWDMVIEPDDACDDLVIDTLLTCTGDSGGIEVPATLAVQRLQATAYADTDGDGYGDDATGMVVCGAIPEGWATLGGDCADKAPFIHPGADETCNAMDDDCDGDIDEGVTSTFYADSDGDGYGDAFSPIQACLEGPGISTNLDDCDDAVATTYPGADEVCDTVDNDCDDSVDEGVTTTYYQDRDEDGYGDPDTPVEACAPGTGIVDDTSDCDDRRDDIHPGALEVCDNLDNDCNGEVDDGAGTTFYADQDGDGYGDEFSTVVACSAPADYTGVPGDCADTDPGTNPAALEACDGVDNDCDGDIDEEAGTLFYLDGDGDGFGLSDDTLLACSVPDGYSAAPGDCDDADAGTNPGATEICDDKDNDCDTEIDEDTLNLFYADADSDGYGDATQYQLACTVPAGYVADSEDCDDTDAAAYPGAAEVCDGIDNDCDGEVDEGLEAFYYVDGDGDGFGSASDVVSACEAPHGYAGNPDDCDDSDAAINPDAAEVCDGVDNDCDGDVDEDLEAVFYADSDGDGYGTDEDVVTACEAPDGYVADAGDCDDTDADVNPGAEERCDDKDNDCNGEVDEVDGCADVSPTATPGGELEGGGCNCNTRGGPSGGTGAWAGFALVGMLWRRRSRYPARYAPGRSPRR